MKKILKLSLLLLTMIMLVNFVACSSFNKVKSALEDAGYAVVENEENSVSKEAEEDERVTNIHIFTNAQSLTGFEVLNVTIVVVIEFKETKELVEYFQESNILQGIVADIKEEGTTDEIYAELKAAGLAYKNCIIAPIGLDAGNVLNIIKAL